MFKKWSTDVESFTFDTENNENTKDPFMILFFPEVQGTVTLIFNVSIEYLHIHDLKSVYNFSVGCFDIDFMFCILSPVENLIFWSATC